MEEKEVQRRKQRAKNGSCESRMMSFRADAETISILDKVANKGRLINELVQKWWKRPRKQWEDPDINPAENDIEEYMT